MKKESEEPKAIEYKDVDLLIYDPDNPRLPRNLRGYKKDEEVLEWMILNENIVELMGSIGEKGYFPAEPLLVVPSSKIKNSFEVVEGNRRLAAVKLLNHPKLAESKKGTIAEVVKEATYKPKDLPVIIFDERDEILVYLGYRHITGIKTWGSLAKAQYLDSLRKTLRIRSREEENKVLAKIIGSKTSYVRSLLTGLIIYNEIEKNNFFRIKGLNEVNVEFGVLYTAVSRKNIAHFVGIDIDADNPLKKINVKHLEELTAWMFEKNSENFTRLGESRNITDLDKVVAHSAALKAFRIGRPLSEAVLLTDKPLEVFRKSLNSSFSQLKISRDQLHNIEQLTLQDLELAEEIQKLLKDVMYLIKGKISGEEADEKE